MDSSDSTMLIIIIICIMLSAYFSATETAFSTANKLRLKTLADKGNKKAIRTLALIDKYDDVLTAILIGNNIVNILSSSLSTIFCINLLDEVSGPTVATIALTLIILIFGEISPKSIVKESPEKFAMWSSTYISVFMCLCKPAAWLFAQWKKLLSKIFKNTDDTGITEEELLSFVEEAEMDGGITKQESEIIQNAIDFTEQEAGNIITPRMEISAISEDATNEEIEKIFAETAYSRLPVYKDTIDHIIGVMYHKDFYNHVYRHSNRNLKTVPEIIRPVVFVPKTKKVAALLKELQAQKTHMAVVLDEYGGTLGICTLEDVLEELVGEIWDEHDEVDEDIVPASESECVIAGDALLSTVFDYLDFEAEDDQPNMTLSMWIMDLLGRCPQIGDRLLYNNMAIEVLEIDEHRAEKVKITQLEKTDEEGEEESEQSR